MSDHCLQREAAQDEKTASGISVFLLEELGDARLRCAQLKKYIDEAVKLIDKSEHRDHFFEVAAHLLHGIPDTLMRMDKALSAAALAAAKLDYEEIKDDLQPEKVEELEKALEDVRIRRVQHRSTEASASNSRDALVTDIAWSKKHGGEAVYVDEEHGQYGVFGIHTGFSYTLGSKEHAEHVARDLNLVKDNTRTAMNIKEASAQLERIAASMEAAGKVDEGSLKTLIANLEGQTKEASGSEVPHVLRELSASLLSAEARPSRLKLASVLRRVLADCMDMSSQVAAGIYSTAGSREDVIKGFREANPNMTEEDLEKAADQWEKNKDVVKKQANKEASARLHELREMKTLMSDHGYDPNDADRLQDEGMGTYELEHILKTTHSGGMGSLEYTHKIHKKQASTTSVADQAIRSRFEEGKPADPTENMDPEDSKKWKQQTDEHKDEFKSASHDVWKA